MQQPKYIGISNYRSTWGGKDQQILYDINTGDILATRDAQYPNEVQVVNFDKTLFLNLLIEACVTKLYAKVAVFEWSGDRYVGIGIADSIDVGKAKIVEFNRDKRIEEILNK